MGGSNGGSEGEEPGWYILNIYWKGMWRVYWGNYNWRLGGGHLEDAKSAQNVQYSLWLAVSLKRQ